jgi:CheY-like chemotaxis protein
VERVLDLSRIEAGRLELDVRPLDVEGLIASLSAAIRPRAAAAGVRFRVDRAPRVPERGLADPDRLRQILLTLLENAVKFTTVGEVLFRVAPAPAGIRFAVTDTGIGIAPDVLPRLFTPFTQADSSTTRPYGGTGLGLSIAQRLAAAMGGRLEVVSTLGTGSTFSLTVPFPPAPPPASARAAPAAELPVLLVDDDDEIADLLRAMLEHLGCRVTRAASGEEALALAREGDFPLVFMDVHMPRMDGFELATRLRAAPAKQRRLYGLSGAATAADRARGLAAGMDDYLTKPVTLDRLRLAVATARTALPA